MTALGRRLIEAAKSTRREMTLIAPFIKTGALKTILDCVSDSSVSIRVVARWIPAEIVAGVCDLEIFELISVRPNAALYIHPLLHAKMYRFDNLIFFGSANLTQRALGWAAPANLEILIAPDAAVAELLAFENALLVASIRVDSALCDSIRQEVDALKSAPPSVAQVFEAETRELVLAWLPTCRAPNRLWNAYSEVEKWRLVQAAYDAAKEDLSALDIPSGLSKDQFTKFVAATLERMPLVQEIDIAAQKGLTPEAAAALISGAAASAALPYSPTEMWEVLQAWLMHFFPDRYRREASSEVFRQGRIIGHLFL